MSLKTMFAAIAAAMLFSHAATAVEMIQPAGVIGTSYGTSAGVLDNVRDQSGLLTPYVAGQDYAAYVGTDPQHAVQSAGNAWQGTPAPGTIDFDLGGLYSLTNLALWNGLTDSGIKDFQLLVSKDAGFASTIDLGPFQARAGGPQPVTVESFDFSNTPAVGAFVRLQVDSVQLGSRNFAILAEVAFGGDRITVPEPGTLLLLGLGLAALGLRLSRAD